MAGTHPMAKRWVPDGQIGTTTLLRHESAIHDPCVGGELLASLLTDVLGPVLPPAISSAAAALETSWRAQQHRSSWTVGGRTPQGPVDVVVQVPLQPSPGMPGWLPRLIPHQHVNVTLSLTSSSSSSSQQDASSSTSCCSSQVMDSAQSLSSSSSTGACPPGGTGGGQVGRCYKGRCQGMAASSCSPLNGLAPQRHPAAAEAAEGVGCTSGQPWVLLIRSCPAPRAPPPAPPWRTTTTTSSSSLPQQPVKPAAPKAPDPTPSKDQAAGLPLLGWLGVAGRLLPWLLHLAAWWVTTTLARLWPPPTAALAGGIAVAVLQDPEGCTRCEGCGTGGDTGAPGDAGTEVTTEVFITCLLKAQLGGWWAPGRPLSPLAGHWQLHAALTRQLLAGLLEAAQHLVAGAPQQQQQQQAEAKQAPTAAACSAEGRCRQHSSSVRGGPGSALGPAAAAAAAAAAAEAVGGGWWGPDPVADPVTGAFPRMGCCPQHIWSPLHTPGTAAPFSVRGAGYLSGARVKVAAGLPALALYSVDLVNTPTPVGHLGRFLPAVRRSPAPYSLVVNMMVPTPAHVINVVMAWGAHWTPAMLAAGVAAADSGAPYPATAPAEAAAPAAAGDGRPVELPPLPFARTLLSFLAASDAGRSDVFKMIPHVEGGPWLLRKSIGTTPVLLGHKMALRYATTPRYLEVDVDVTSCAVAGHIVGAVQGLASGLTVDLAYLLEGRDPGQLPEVLAGAVRFSGMDLAAGVGLDMTREIPLRDG